MQTIKQIGNVTKYFLDNELLLTITKLNNEHFIIENKFSYMEGTYRNIDDFTAQIKFITHCSKGKNGRLYKTKKLIESHSSWFAYILQEYGFVQKPKVIA